MSRRIAQVWVLGLLMAVVPSVRAQIPFTQNLVPNRTALGRLGLERHWTGVVPLQGPERVLQLSLSGDLLFAQTNSGQLHVYDAESGKHLWSADLGTATIFARPASANSFAVFASNAGNLLAYERKSGRLLWQARLDNIPSSATVCDEERVAVGLSSGEIVAYALKKKDDQGHELMLTAPIKIWNWRIGGPLTTRPLFADRIVILGGADGKVYVAFSDVQEMIFRVATGGPIGEGFASYGTRTLIAPSADDVVYGIDLFTAQVKWKFPTGSPIVQAPIVSGEDVFIINAAGGLSKLDPNTGLPHWTTGTHGARLQALSKSKIYLTSENRDLYVVDRVTGNTLLDPIATYQRAGLNVRELELGFTNSTNDRMYFGTSSGLIVCIREIGQIQPLSLKDPKALPFGYVPPEGLKNTPSGLPPAEFRVGGETTDPAANADGPGTPDADKADADKPKE